MDSSIIGKHISNDYHSWSVRMISDRREHQRIINRGKKHDIERESIRKAFMDTSEGGLLSSLGLLGLGSNYTDTDGIRMLSDIAEQMDKAEKDDGLLRAEIRARMAYCGALSDE